MIRCEPERAEQPRRSRFVQNPDGISRGDSGSASLRLEIPDASSANPLAGPEVGETPQASDDPVGGSDPFRQFAMEVLVRT